MAPSPVCASAPLRVCRALRFRTARVQYAQRGFESKTKSGGSQQRLLAFGVRIGAEIGAIHCGTVESVAECKIVEIANINRFSWMLMKRW